ncbi:MAG: AraC family transcriptional activator of mtrCDE [Cryomorphaceae bacterium]|jgi:AraC family transcriptional activator of mtrCDE
MSALSQLLATLKVEANVFHNGQYCGMWAIDTSGTQEMSFHVVTHGTCYM